MKIRSVKFEFLFLILFLHAVRINPAIPSRLFIWNVGQGLWVTQVSSDSCVHQDMGGEKWDAQKVMHECASKQNEIHFSHWDWDHISFARQAANRLGDFCIRTPPQGPHNKRKKELLARLPECPSQKTTDLKKGIQGLSFKEVPHNPAKKYRKANDHSRVFQFGEFLLPGDSTSTQEKFWVQKLREPGKIKTLVAGHHGSRTSTSYALLRGLTGLRTAVISARQRRYGHPHRDVLKKLKDAGVSVLRTEDWNNLVFEIHNR